MDERSELVCLGHDEQGLRLDGDLALLRLERAPDPELAVALPDAVVAHNVVVVAGDGGRADDVEGVGQGRGAVPQLEVGGDAGVAREPQDGAAAERLVEQGGQGAAVDDAGPAGEGGAEVDDGDDLAGGRVVEDALEGEARGPAHGARGDARPGGDAGVRVPGRPGRVGRQLLDEGQGGAALPDLVLQVDVPV